MSFSDTFSASLSSISAKKVREKLKRTSFVQGFYRTLPHLKNWLVIGPYQGTHGCLRIPFGKGVCGTAAKLQQTQVLPPAPEASHRKTHAKMPAAIRIETSKGLKLSAPTLDWSVQQC